jgi:hypothetical protein
LNSRSDFFTSSWVTVLVLSSEAELSDSQQILGRRSQPFSEVLVVTRRTLFQATCVCQLKMQS